MRRRYLPSVLPSVLTFLPPTSPTSCRNPPRSTSAGCRTRFVNARCAIPRTEPARGPTCAWCGRAVCGRAPAASRETLGDSWLGFSSGFSLGFSLGFSFEFSPLWCSDLGSIGEGCDLCPTHPAPLPPLPPRPAHLGTNSQKSVP